LRNRGRGEAKHRQARNNGDPLKHPHYGSFPSAGETPVGRARAQLVPVPENSRSGLDCYPLMRCCLPSMGKFRGHYTQFGHEVSELEMV
jgi:hypothetical protein